MKYVLGIFFLIIGLLFYIKPDIFTENINVIFGTIFISLGNLYFNYKKEDR